MRIAMLASNFIKLPPIPLDIPKGYSGAPEYIAWTITESLVKRGHKVTLFASGDSKTSASLVSVSSTPVCKQEEGKPLALKLFLGVILLVFWQSLLTKRERG